LLQWSLKINLPRDKPFHHNCIQRVNCIKTNEDRRWDCDNNWK